LVPEVRKWFPRGTYKLVYDRATQHTSKVSQAHLTTLGAASVDLPAQSWDINIIENVWGILNNTMLGRTARTTDGWRQAIKEAWDAVPQAAIDSLVSQVKGRMGKVVEAEGEW
jgi:hypothetical protein